MKVQASFPEKLEFLFQPARYKVARGGRGSGKSWSFARALLLKAMQRPLRVLCVREVQKSIRDSVHRLLSDQINLLGLNGFFTVQETVIKGALNDSLFLFCGLSELTADQLKSYEGIDIVWAEEAHTITKRSWDILIPTIRKEHSEIWISYNPELESDETHQRFTLNPPADCINSEVNWRDNPWFPEVLDKERRHCLAYDPDNYDNIWEGHCKPAVAGAIYFKQIQEMEAAGRICSVPYDPMLNVHVVCDPGHRDASAIGMVQRNPSSVRIIDYIEGDHLKTTDYSEMLRTRKYRWGKVWLPHDGYSTNINSASTAVIMSSLGWSVPDKEVIMSRALGKEDGIKATRELFSTLYIDKERCSQLVEHLKRYRRIITMRNQSETAGDPLHDEHSHAADMLRYVACNAPIMYNTINTESYTPPRKIRPRKR
ncbi:MAG: PBSX family phage terminase large subunit [Sphaerochaeta sp.]|jgi:phage terminase large subunit|nr:PBSX family phage terminase large subunit [Sphaerochaeta sp.]